LETIGYGSIRNDVMKFIGLGFLLLIVGSIVQAEEVVIGAILDSNEEGSPVGRTEGQIRSIDLEARTAIISGFIYHFGASTLADPLEVRLLGRDFGSLELLLPEMHVEIQYNRVGEFREGKKITQIEKSEET
jgi:hypothetical protein